jgi:hypothetical protein
MAFGSGFLNKISKWGYPRVGSNPTLFNFWFFLHHQEIELMEGYNSNISECRKVVK